MAKENGAPIAAEKGKGKAVEEKPKNGQKKLEESKKDKDGKPIVNGKKGDEPEEGMCLEEDDSPILLTILLRNRRVKRGRPKSEE